MVSIVSLLIILTFSILITRIATVALTLTGLSRESARFQARSAFTGVGFTTAEAEKVVGHPVRRRILFTLMLLGNVGIITVISSLILSFIDTNGSVYARIFLLLLGLGLLLAVATSHWIDKHLSLIIQWALKRYTRLDIKDYAGLLNLSGEYRVTEMKVKPESWMADKTLRDLNLRDEGILVLGINRASGKYLGVPNGSTKIRPRDTVVLYGRSSNLNCLNERLKGHEGDLEHKEISEEQRWVEREEREKDEVGDEKASHSGR